MHEMLIAKLAETARRFIADSCEKVATIALRVHVDAEDQTRVTYVAHVGDFPKQIVEVADSLEKLIAEITPQLVELKDQHTREVRDLHTQAKSLGYAVVPVGSVVSPPINWMARTATSPGVAVLEGGE